MAKKKVVRDSARGRSRTVKPRGRGRGGSRPKASRFPSRPEAPLVEAPVTPLRQAARAPTALGVAPRRRLESRPGSQAGFASPAVVTPPPADSRSRSAAHGKRLTGSELGRHDVKHPPAPLRPPSRAASAGAAVMCFQCNKAITRDEFHRGKYRCHSRCYNDWRNTGHAISVAPSGLLLLLLLLLFYFIMFQK